MQKIISILKTWPLHVALLPVYFIMSIYVQLAGLLYTGEAVKAFITVLVSVGVLFGLLILLYKNKAKAGFVTTILGILFLFFGDIKNVLAAFPLLKYISSYTILLPLVLIIMVLTVYRTRKAKSVKNGTLFLNILLLIYIGIETFKWVQLAARERSVYTRQQLAPPAQAMELPSIYFIVMDGYPSTRYQREVLGASHNTLDSSLASLGFRTLPLSTSNYNYTGFSIASSFQLQYLGWLKGVTKAKPAHFSRSTVAVKNSAVIKWLGQAGYDLYNLSVFDLPGQPTLSGENFVFANAWAYIFYNTLWTRVKWDILPLLFPSFKKTIGAAGIDMNRQSIGHLKPYNKKVLDSLYRLASEPYQPKRFIYAHLEMPHYPYFYDSTGRPYPDEEIYSGDMANNKNRFSNYIGYINQAMYSLLDSMMRYHNGRDIIILQSDHGSRNMVRNGYRDEFSNYSAFYFPDKDYHLLYDSMSNINTFRVVFNKYFGQKLPLLKDSSSYIHH